MLPRGLLPARLNRWVTVMAPFGTPQVPPNALRPRAPEPRRAIESDALYHREVAGVFHSGHDLEMAIRELERVGCDRAEINLVGAHNVLAPQDDAAAVMNQSAGPVTEDDVRQTRTLAAGVAGVVAAFIATGATILSGGTALAAVIGAAAAGGGTTAAVELIARFFGAGYSTKFADQLQNGGVLLWVRLRAPDQEAQVREILLRHGADHVHAQEAAA
jgi:hypothetical protein